MIWKSKLSHILCGFALLSGVQAVVADGHEEITVAYFLEWPMPFQYAKETRMYDDALGTKVNWVSFDTGTAMSAAMASGDVQLAVSQGVPPFVVATSAGQDLQIVDVAVSYADNDNCVVRSELEIDKNSANELTGKKVAVPLGTAAHYGFLKQMEHFNVALDSLQIVDMAPAEGEAALSQGAVDMACGWGGALRRMLESGNVLLTGTEKTDLGILVFDATSAPTAFIAENPDLVAKFLAVTAEANAMWADEANRSRMLPVIAKDAGMSQEDTAATLETFVFPTVEEQLSSAWLGGAAVDFLKGVAEVFLAAGSIDATKASYADNVNIGPLSQ
ncbi:MAG: ABC transporter substrate-binding protein [Aestuariivita sp.]|nr:ABC transporter substrate-binding protein [Aestuariivita sp.]MCY4203483.1 ABC transporter substrate-binding protein [Aestuariivita sp.]MCY4288064.1 ABC transporter substrate-binding protein [Aestuariivita sp.]MCY4346368.1 ABC transporter substrate-binding protein [Aestuariivita sp.]